MYRQSFAGTSFSAGKLAIARLFLGRNNVSGLSRTYIHRGNCLSIARHAKRSNVLLAKSLVPMYQGVQFNLPPLYRPASDSKLIFRYIYII